MSSPITTRVPEGMSCVNAFRALWENSKPATSIQMHQTSNSFQPETVATAEKVAELFKSYFNFDYEGGRLLKADFSNFPELECSLYDKAYGPKAAQKALDQYNQIPSYNRFDMNDSYQFEDFKSHIINTSTQIALSNLK